MAGGKLTRGHTSRRAAEKPCPRGVRAALDISVVTGRAESEEVPCRAPGTKLPFSTTRAGRPAPLLDLPGGSAGFETNPAALPRDPFLRDRAYREGLALFWVATTAMARPPAAAPRTATVATPPRPWCRRPRARRSARAPGPGRPAGAPGARSVRHPESLRSWPARSAGRVGPQQESRQACRGRQRRRSER